MSKTMIIPMKKRAVLGKSVRALRRGGKLPAIVHAFNNSAISVELDSDNFKHALGAGLIEIKIDEEEPEQAIIQSIAYDPQTDCAIHVDFCIIDKNKKIITEIPIKFTGASLVIQEAGGILVQRVNKVKIECLSDQLIKEIVFDLSSIKSFVPFIHIKDFSIPNGIRLTLAPDTVVATVEKAKADKKVNILEEKSEKDAIADIHIVSKDKKVKNKDTEISA